MTMIENVNWVSDDPPLGGNEYINEVILYLETVVSTTASQILPTQVHKRVLHDVISHISEMIVGTLVSDSVKRFNVSAINGIDTDIKLLESFVETQATLFFDGDADQFKSALAEARQMVNLLVSNHPENFLNPVIRERSYSALDHKKVVIVSEKLKDPSDRLFGTFGSRGSRQNPKKKSLDTLIKRLRDVS
uniref:Exocyst complex subunit EXOC6/Sec15 C-terminal domain-containing protein n=1 Tax=Medicago truncatula TaxID=3880 RepID=I3S5H2_MEDTR|nr:unknown [Medicago truncatula]